MMKQGRTITYSGEARSYRDGAMSSVDLEDGLNNVRAKVIGRHGKYLVIRSNRSGAEYAIPSTTRQPDEAAA
jgi:hypothetical protein